MSRYNNLCNACLSFAIVSDSSLNTSIISLQQPRIGFLCTFAWDQLPVEPLALAVAAVVVVAAVAAVVVVAAAAVAGKVPHGVIREHPDSSRGDDESSIQRDILLEVRRFLCEL